MIYFNHATTTIEIPDMAKNHPPVSVEEARDATKEFFGLKKSDQVQLTDGGKQAVELALRSFLKRGDHVIVSPMEQDTTWILLEQLKKEWNLQISLLRISPYGVLQYDEIPNLIRKNTRAVICAHGCGVTGNIADLERISAITRRYGLLLISDGCQTAGAIPVNLTELGADVYCFTAHKKMMGPHGLGGVCTKENLSLNQEQIRQIQQPDGNKLGMYCGSLKFIAEKGLYGVGIFPHRLAKRFFEAVKSMKEVTVYGDFGTNLRLPIVSIKVKDHSPKEVKEYLARRHKIVVDGGLQQEERMHRALGTEKEGLVRFSFGYFNTRQQVNDGIWAMMDLLGLDDLYLLS